MLRYTTGVHKDSAMLHQENSKLIAAQMKEKLTWLFTFTLVKTHYPVLLTSLIALYSDGETHYHIAIGLHYRDNSTIDSIAQH